MLDSLAFSKPHLLGSSKISENVDNTFSLLLSQEIETSQSLPVITNSDLSKAEKKPDEEITELSLEEEKKEFETIEPEKNDFMVETPLIENKNDASDKLIILSDDSLISPLVSGHDESNVLPEGEQSTQFQDSELNKRFGKVGNMSLGITQEVEKIQLGRATETNFTTNDAFSNRVQTVMNKPLSNFSDAELDEKTSNIFFSNSNEVKKENHVLSMESQFVNNKLSTGSDIPVQENVPQTISKQIEETKREMEDPIFDIRIKKNEMLVSQVPQINNDVETIQVVEQPSSITKNPQGITKEEIAFQKANINEIVSVIKKEAEFISDGKNHQFKLSLKPENLGELDILLDVKDGKLSAKFLVETDKVKELIKTSLPVLQENLVKQNIVVEKADVTLTNFSENSGFQFSGDLSQRQQQSKFLKSGKLSQQYQASENYEETKSNSSLDSVDILV